MQLVDLLPPKSEISICDNNPILASQLLSILQSNEWISSRFRISHISDVGDLFSAVCPKILVFDPSQEIFHKKDWRAQINKLQGRTALIGYCSYIAASDARELISSGFRAVIPKTIGSEELVQVVSAVSYNGTYIHEIYRENTDSAQTLHNMRGQISLTGRESEVLRQVALGNSLKEIAASLELSTKTVDTYKTRANRKLDLRSRSDIVRYAIQSGWMKEASLPLSSE